MSTIELAAIPSIDDIVSDLLAIIRTHTKTPGETWTAETTIEEAGIDSFDFVELIFELEDKYNIHINFNSNAADGALKTVDDVARFVQAQIRQERRAK